MDTLQQVGVNSKLYRSWFNLNKQTTIKVNTAVGMTKCADAGELIGQGSAGGALASQINIDRGLNGYFQGSVDEICYGGVRLQPLAFQDDIARLTTDMHKASVGNVKMEYLMKEKQLEVHPDKTGYIVMGTKGYRDQIMMETGINPIKFDGFETKRKKMDKYLGEMFHEEGLAASVNASIDDRMGKVKASMYEVAAIVDDFRMQAVGGMVSAWELWNLAIIPSLLSNCGVWTEISEKAVERLEDLQNVFIRRVLQVPVSTPKVSLRSETGMLSMKLRIWASKVKMVMALRMMDKKFLARQVYDEQVRQGWPGLAREVAEVCLQIDLPDANSLDVTKSQVDKAIKEYNKVEIKEAMTSKYTKLDDLVEMEDSCLKEYMKMKNLAESRMMFRIRTKMVNLKENMKGKFKGSSLDCTACDVWKLSHKLMY